MTLLAEISYEGVSHTIVRLFRLCASAVMASAPPIKTRDAQSEAFRKRSFGKQKVNLLKRSER